MDVSESSPAIHQLRRRSAQKPQLSPVTVRQLGLQLATGVLGTVVFAALVLAVQERQPNANDLSEQRQAEGDLLLNPCGATNSDRGPNS